MRNNPTSAPESVFLHFSAKKSAIVQLRVVQMRSQVRNQPAAYE
jgi:hypothetical protein